MNIQEPSWRADARAMRFNLTQSKLPYNFYGDAYDDGEQAGNLLPSRAPPHDCALGRLLSTPSKKVKPKGAFKRPFGALCYPTVAPRWPSGTLKNKAAPQSERCILLGYCGDQGGAFETIGTSRAQPGYICFNPELNEYIVTDDVRIIPDCFPGLQRTSGGGWCIPTGEIPFISDVRGAQQAGGQRDGLVEVTRDEDIPDAGEGETAESLDIRPGFAPEGDGAQDQPSHEGDAPSGGGDAPSGGGDEPPPPPQEQPPTRYLVPSAHWPDYECRENEGKGWEVTVVRRDGQWSRCKFVNPGADGNPWENVWQRTDKLIRIDPAGDEATTPSPAPLPPPPLAPNIAPPAPSPSTLPPPLTTTPPEHEHLDPNRYTVPHAPGADPLREPTRPSRERREPDRLTY